MTEHDEVMRPRTLPTMSDHEEPIVLDEIIDPLSIKDHQMLRDSGRTVLDVLAGTVPELDPVEIIRHPRGQVGARSRSGSRLGSQFRNGHTRARLGPRRSVARADSARPQRGDSVVLIGCGWMPSVVRFDVAGCSGPAGPAAKTRRMFSVMRTIRGSGRGGVSFGQPA